MIQRRDGFTAFAQTVQGLAGEAAPPLELHCTCCQTAYVRGQWQCCAPRSGMASHVWLALWCHDCGTGTCGKCPKHCTCHKERQIGNLPKIGKGEDIRFFVKRIAKQVERDAKMRQAKDSE